MSGPILHRIPGVTVFPPETLFGSYISNAAGALRATIGDFAAGSGDWERQWGRAGDAAPNDMAAALSSYCRAVGCGDRIVEHAARLGSGDVRVVITGQQPGALGGPLMSLYKIETAIALAARLERERGVPYLPVYWMGADDDDFAEVRDATLLSPELAPVSAAIAARAHAPGLPVGGVSADAVRAVWAAVAPYAGEHPGGAFVGNSMERALDAGADHGEVTARVIAALTRGDVAIVDARAPDLRTAARELILRYFDEEEAAKEAVEAAGRQLEAGGFHAQLRSGADSGVFVDEGGRRGRVAPELRAEARARLDADVTVAYPGVVLRNLVQDAVFRPDAVVLGPAEVAYRGQLLALYERFGVPRPVVFPRLFATAVPSTATELLAEGADAEAMVLSTDEFVARVYEASRDEKAASARSRLLEATNAEIDTFVSLLGASLDRGHTARLEKRMGDVRRRLEQAADVVSETGKAAALARWPYLEALPGVFARRGDPQERFLSMLTPFLLGGEAASERIRAAASAHVDDAMDGRVSHIVYSV